jgi:hypothetical protein
MVSDVRAIDVGFASTDASGVTPGWQLGSLAICALGSTGRCGIHPTAHGRTSAAIRMFCERSAEPWRHPRRGTRGGTRGDGGLSLEIR